MRIRIDRQPPFGWDGAVTRVLRFGWVVLLAAGVSSLSSCGALRNPVGAATGLAGAAVSTATGVTGSAVGGLGTLVGRGGNATARAVNAANLAAGKAVEMAPSVAAAALLVP